MGLGKRVIHWAIIAHSHLLLFPSQVYEVSGKVRQDGVIAVLGAKYMLYVCELYLYCYEI